MSRHRFSARSGRPTVDELTRLARFEAEFEHALEPDLDDITVARLLCGSSVGATATEDERRLAALMGALSAPPTARELGLLPSAATLRALAVAEADPYRNPLRHGLVAVVAAGALAVGGVAAAYTGSLPAPVEQLAQHLGAPAAIQPRHQVTAAAPGHVASPGQVTKLTAPPASSHATATPTHPVPTHRTSAPHPPSKAAASKAASAGTEPSACRIYETALLGKDTAKASKARQALIRAAGDSSKVTAYCGFHRAQPSARKAPPRPSPAGKHRLGRPPVRPVPILTASPVVVGDHIVTLHPRALAGAIRAPQPPSQDSSRVRDGSTDGTPPAAVG